MKITLCGSTRFKQAFEDWNALLTQNGHLVYSCGFYARSDGPNATLSEEQKRQLDLVHLEKICASDAIMVLNVVPADYPDMLAQFSDMVRIDLRLGYYGDSTRREIEWAALQNRLLYALHINKGLPYSQFIGAEHIFNAFNGGPLIPPFDSPFFDLRL
jgi:hypothetical protein